MSAKFKKKFYVRKLSTKKSLEISVSVCDTYNDGFNGAKLKEENLPSTLSTQIQIIEELQLALALLLCIFSFIRIVDLSRI